MENKTELLQLCEAFCAHFMSGETIGYEELSLGEIREGYKQHDGVDFNWGSAYGVYYFANGDGRVEYVGSATGKDRGIGWRAHAWVIDECGRNYQQRPWASLLDDSGSRFGAWPFPDRCWYMALALEYFLICELSTYPRLCDRPTERATRYGIWWNPR